MDLHHQRQWIKRRQELELGGKTISINCSSANDKARRSSEIISRENSAFNQPAVGAITRHTWSANRSSSTDLKAAESSQVPITQNILTSEIVSRESSGFNQAAVVGANGTNKKSTLGGKSSMKKTKTPAPALSENSLSTGRLSCSKTTHVYVKPRAQDVLFGRGRPTQCHPGNVRFRLLLELHADEYECAASKFDKTLLAARLVHTVTSADARFLKPVDGDRWVQVDEMTAHEKVAQNFRTRRRKR
jgi:hypothetical protein